MSLKGKMMSVAGNLRETLQQLRDRDMKDVNGNVPGTQKILGYVTEIHTGDDENDALKWTVDVAEYGYDPDDSDFAFYHEGCLLSAVRNNAEGIMIVPSLGSEVIVEKDPSTNEEFVTMFSHVDIVNLNSHKKVRASVVETDDFDWDDDNGADYDELAKTGRSSVTEHTPDGIKSEVLDGDNGSVVEQTAEKVAVNVCGNGGVEIGSDGIPHVNGNSNHLVLFEKLSSTLNSLCDAIHGLTVIIPDGTGTCSPATQSAIDNVKSTISQLKSEALLVGK